MSNSLGRHGVRNQPTVGSGGSIAPVLAFRALLIDGAESYVELSRIAIWYLLVVYRNTPTLRAHRPAPDSASMLVVLCNAIFINLLYTSPHRQNSLKITINMPFGLPIHAATNFPLNSVWECTIPHYPDYTRANRKTSLGQFATRGVWANKWGAMRAASPCPSAPPATRVGESPQAGYMHVHHA
jgi:hypothetical protein